MLKDKIMLIGVSGDVGSFSEEAGLIYAAKAHSAKHEIRYLIDMDGVLAALERGEIDVGIFPFVNYNSGIVWPAFTAMGKYNFMPIDDLQLNVEQCLLAKLGTDLSEINELYSYTPAFEQCKGFINQHGFKLIDWGDTAKAARDLAAGILPKNAGVVASAQAAKSYDLQIVKRGIQDIQPNITRFIVVKKAG
ncbi:MAG: chorismate mutase [Neisseriales bacterium]|nr:MAG: chorismate mutase [Neisseriales bacterium]